MKKKTKQSVLRIDLNELRKTNPAIDNIIKRTELLKIIIRLEGDRRKAWMNTFKDILKSQFNQD